MQSSRGNCVPWTLLLLLFPICAFTVIASEVMRAPSGYDVKQKSLTQRTDTSKAYKEWKQNKEKKNSDELTDGLRPRVGEGWRDKEP